MVRAQPRARRGSRAAWLRARRLRAAQGRRGRRGGRGLRVARARDRRGGARRCVRGAAGAPRRRRPRRRWRASTRRSRCTGGSSATRRLRAAARPAFPRAELAAFARLLREDAIAAALEQARAALASVADAAAVLVPVVTSLVRHRAHAEARALIAEHAARLDDGLADLLHGKVLLAMGDAASAVRHLEAACAVPRPFFQARHLLPQALRGAGRPDEARAAMQRVASGGAVSARSAGDARRVELARRRSPRGPRRDAAGDRRGPAPSPRAAAYAPRGVAAGAGRSDRGARRAACTRSTRIPATAAAARSSRASRDPQPARPAAGRRRWDTMSHDARRRPGTATVPYPDRADDADTLVPRPPRVDAAGSIAADDATGTVGAYALGEVIGRGGMGEVLLAHDRRIGRDVAIKRLITAEPTEQERARFLREARIQARLEHPAIVPVHELGTDERGRPYFTMKRLAGHDARRVCSPTAMQPDSACCARSSTSASRSSSRTRAASSTAISSRRTSCSATSARSTCSTGASRACSRGRRRRARDAPTVDTLDGEHRRPATLLGTPGYMAPEQVRGERRRSRPADVYALGAILFEILAGEPLHPRGQPRRWRARSRGATRVARASARRDRDDPARARRAVLAALAERRRRIGRPRASSASASQRYLDGDRDLARRRTLAGDLVAARAMRSGERSHAATRCAAPAARSRSIPRPPTPPSSSRTLMLEPPADAAGRPRRSRRSDAEAISATHARRSPATPDRDVPPDHRVERRPVVAGRARRRGSRSRWRSRRGDSVRLPQRRSATWSLRVRQRAPARDHGPAGRAAPRQPALVSFVTASVVTYPAFLGRPWVLIGIMLGGFLVPVALETPACWRRPGDWSRRPADLRLTGCACRARRRSSRSCSRRRDRRHGRPPVGA